LRKGSGANQTPLPSCKTKNINIEEVLKISNRNAVLCDNKKVANYSGSVDDQTLIYIMAGEL
jgi:hypothetical protein